MNCGITLGSESVLDCVIAATFDNQVRPIYAGAAKDQPGSRRVREKCGFKSIGESKGFANAPRQEMEELLLELAE